LKYNKKNYNKYEALRNPLFMKPLDLKIFD
jgi:hypothetical protein